MSLMKELIKGKVKTVYAVDNVEHVMIMYHDKVTAGNGAKEDRPVGKGEINCAISTLLFNMIRGVTIRTHHISTVGPTMLCQKVDIVPIEVVVRNIAAGSIVRQTTIEEGTVFDTPLIEFYLKDDDKNDPLLTKRRLRLMGYDLHKEIEPLEQMAYDVNYKLRRIFEKIGLTLVDFKLEFGYDVKGNLLLADELSPDGMRLWKQGTQESMDKDLFRKGDGNIIEAYSQILDSLNKLVLSTNNDCSD
jgi:phosphoribosylaminoimidazole-succinocarboxamide synthase